MMNSACVRRSAVLLVGLVLTLISSSMFAPATVAHPAAKPASGIVAPFGLTAVPVTGAEIPPPPPPPIDSNGVRLKGSWQGPYTFRNLNSDKCLDILGASQAPDAPAVQYTCVAGGVSQMWWTYFLEGDGSVAYQLYGNAYSQMCLAPGYPWAPNAPVVQVSVCSDQPLLTWIWSSASDIRRNEDTQYCFETQGGSKANFAPIVLWHCHGQAHQQWLTYLA